MNPCFYFEKDPNSTPKIVKKDTNQILRNGDIFGFQAQQYKYALYLEGFDNLAASETASATASGQNSVNGSNKNKKIVDGDEDTKDTIDTDNGKAEPKKRGRKPKAAQKNAAKAEESDDYQEEDDDEDDDEEEIDEDESEEEVAKTRGRGRASNASTGKGRPRRAQKSAASNVSLDDFVASDEDWSSDESPVRAYKGKRPEESDEDSDWEMDSKRGRGGGRRKNYQETDSSDSDWGKKKKKVSLLTHTILCFTHAL